MYRIYADEVLIYDSTLEDYKIGKGEISREVNKAGSFVFSIYPDHFFYDSFVRLKTVITVYKSDKIIFRGRILSDVTDYWNNKVITCEGELGFLQDSIIRPFDFSGTPEELFRKFITEHNSQVDAFKRFNIGTITVVDSTGDGKIERYNTGYDSTLSNMNSRLLEDKTSGGNFYITHGDDGTEEIPTIHYLVDFSKISTQTIEFGENLKNYTKTVKADEIATAIIPLGAEIDDGNDETENKRLTIESAVTDGRDYVSDSSAVSLYGWIFKVVEWSDVTEAETLKSKAEAYLADVIKQNITIELNAIDLHLIDRSIESFNICEYVRVISPPHDFDMTLLCSKQTIDILRPDNDSVTLGRTYSAFTESSGKIQNNIKRFDNVYATKTEVSNKLKTTVVKTEKIIGETEEGILQAVSKTYITIDTFNTTVETLNASISTLPGNILLEVSGTYASKEYVNGSLALKINTDANGKQYSTLDANVDRILFNTGQLEIKSTNLTVDPDGTITSKAGFIGGFGIGATELKYENTDELGRYSLLQIRNGTGFNTMSINLEQTSNDGSHTRSILSPGSLRLFSPYDFGNNNPWLRLITGTLSNPTAIYRLYLDHASGTVKFYNEFA